MKNDNQVVQVLAKPVTPLLTAYRKHVVDVYRNKDGNRLRLGESENTRVCEALGNRQGGGA